MADGIAITGPTASGKTGLAIAVARELDGEIISMDSRQVYRGMDVGTAKPSSAQRALVPHFGIDVLPPSERYNAGRFAADARRWIEQIQARLHVPVLVGGTGFFLRALTHPMFGEPPLDPRRKEQLKQYLGGFTREEDEATHGARTGVDRRAARGGEITAPLVAIARRREQGEVDRGKERF